MERRRLMWGLAGALAATLALAVPASAGILGDTTGLTRGPTPSAEAEALASRQAAEAVTSQGNIQLAQYYSSGRYRRGPRCWNEMRTVRYRDRWGRVHYRQVSERVCR